MEDYLEPGRNGRTSLLPTLTSHRPLDLVIIMLGTNDLKERFHITESDIQTAAEVLIRDILQYPFAPKYKNPQILIMAPIHIKEGISKTFGSFSETAVKRSHAFAQQQKQAAEKYHCLFFDAASVAAASDEDKLHMNRENHEKLAQALSVYIKELFS